MLVSDEYPLIRLFYSEAFHALAGASAFDRTENPGSVAAVLLKLKN